jgi:hypothetical protein
MSDQQIPTLSRPAFFNGQQLRAADLSAVQSFHRELRWLHNRALHDWGIAFGFAVNGLTGARTVQLEAGYALDCQGRDLILSEATELAVPAVASAADGGPVTYYLTVSYAPDEKLTPELRAGVCGTSGAIRRPEMPHIRWLNPDQAGFRYGLDVVLGAIQVQNCQLAADVSSAERRDAIPPQQPFIFGGSTERGNTPWSIWPSSTTSEPVQNAIGVTTRVSTAEAGFRNTPQYQAHVVGTRNFILDTIGVIDGYSQVANPSASGFDLRVILPNNARSGFWDLNPPEIIFQPEFMNRLTSIEQDEGGLGWYVVWMGIEN